MNESKEFEQTIDRFSEISEDRDEILDLFACAKQFIDGTIVEAIKKVSTRETQNLKSEDFCPGCEIINEDEWPISGQMSVRAGLRCVKKMMKKWKNEPAMRGWKFYAEFIGLDSDGSSDFYSYQVRWSFPTPAYPEPQVIVSVFFTVEATKVKFSNCPVHVSYVFEGNQFPHRPKMPFRPKFIYDVLDLKTMMFKSFNF